MLNQPADQYRVVEAFPEMGTEGNLHIYDGLEEGERPFVLGIHGGGWGRGDQSSFAWLWPRLRALGVSLVLPTYRKAPENPFPAAYEDLVKVGLWLARNGSAQSLDPSRCVLLGSSAGAHLALLLATRGMLGHDDLPAFRGVATYCGPSNLTTQHEFESACGIAMTQAFLATEPVENGGVHRLASPVNYLHERMPPLWIAHGSADSVVPVSQSWEMVEAVRKAGCDPIYHEARGIGHTMCEHDPDGVPMEPWQLLFEPDLLRFIKRAINQEAGAG